MNTEGKITRNAVNLFVIKDGKVLLGKRKNAVGSGTWAIPGGHVHYNEQLVEAAKRELLEETGVVGEELEFLHVINSRAIDHYVHVNFLVKRWKGEIVNGEPDYCEGWEWFGLDDLPKDIFPPNRGFFEAYRENMRYFEDVK